MTKLPTFEFDKVRQALDEAEQKAQLELEGEVRRGRIFPESLKRAQQEIVSLGAFELVKPSPKLSR